MRIILVFIVYIFIFRMLLGLLLTGLLDILTEDVAACLICLEIN
jgi:hypothetical protein